MTAANRRVLVDPRLCEAHALCVELAPEVFHLGDDVATCDAQPAHTWWDHIRAAVDACPRGAITIESEPMPVALERAGRTSTS